MTFESDLEALSADLHAAPSQLMRARHQRRRNPSLQPMASVMAQGRLVPRYGRVIALYRADVVNREKPIVVVAVDPYAEFELEQGGLVMAHGWPVVGRAVVVEINGLLVQPVYPCVSPVLRAMRFKQR